ncbi:MAG: hypothetical protein ACRETG_04160 [Steroidobacteraceae bacterium]
MPDFRIASLAVLSLGVLVLAGCGRSDKATAVGAALSLDVRDQPLRDDFNRDQGSVRLMFLVDPICPDCLRGLADMGDDLLSRLPRDARVRVYVIHEPVIGGGEQDIPAAAELLQTTLARQYWNPTGDFGRQMSKALNFWNGHRWVYAWDTWLIYPPDSVWSGEAPPKPAWLMHQLGGLRGDPRFPYLDSKVFATKVNEMLANLNAASTPR